MAGRVADGGWVVHSAQAAGAAGVPDAAGVAAQVGVQGVGVGGQGVGVGHAFRGQGQDAAAQRGVGVHQHPRDGHGGAVGACGAQQALHLRRVGGGKAVQRGAVQRRVGEHGGGEDEGVGQAVQVARVGQQAEIHVGRGGRVG